MTDSNANKPRVLIIGGPDVDSRIPFICELAGQFEFFVLGSNPELKAAFQRAGISYGSYEMKRGTNPVADLLMLDQLTKKIARQRVDIVHTFDTKPCVWGRLAARHAGIQVIVGTLPGLGVLFSQDGLRMRLVRNIYQPLQKLACSLSDMTIFQNVQDAEQFIQNRIASREKTVIVPGSGLETKLFDPQRFSKEKRQQIRTSLNLNDNQTVVTMVSRLIRSKGVLEYAHVAKSVCSRYPQTVFLLVGSEDRQSLDGLTSEEIHQLESAVNCLGARADVPDLLAITDIFVLPTYYREGIPRVLLEAASMGLPIVTTESPGCAEIVNDHFNGFLIPVREQAALVKAVDTLITDPVLRKQFGQESRNLAVKIFDISLIARQTAQLYHQLLSHKTDGNWTPGKSDGSE